MTDSTAAARGPDWEGFGRDLMENWPTGDIGGGELFEAALRNGLIREVPGGYDPEQHIDAEAICPETGDPWYEYAFGPTRADLAPDPLADARVKALVEALRDMRRQFSPYPSEDTERWREEHESCEAADAALAAFDKGGKDE